MDLDIGLIAAAAVILRQGDHHQNHRHIAIQVESITRFVLLR
jgi:hypothetical protein